MSATEEASCMADPAKDPVSPTYGYVVLREVDPGHWYLVGEADRKPGLTARKSRIQAVIDTTGSEPDDGETYAVLPRSEWRVGRQL
jgi:hypothetical protein